ncbi:PAS domain-containing protein [Pedobacter alpinus]|uniref:histidine kinase n=1 Tax=Pedobacter alpinus TaxID=1590643 RepID=A0ABW5TRP4_9SPHI
MMNDNYLKSELYSSIKNDEQIFDFIQDNCLDGLWYWDLEKPENEWMNPRFWHILGYNPNEMLHSPSAWQHIINQNDLQVAIDNLQKHLANENHPYVQIVRYRHKEGHTVWIRCKGKAIRDQQGKPTRMLGVHNDITDFKNKEIRYKSLIEGTNVGTWEWNVQTGQTVFNERWANIVGFTLDELAPISIETWMKLAHPDDLEESGRRLNECFEKKAEYYEFEARMRHKNGQWVWVFDRGKVFEWTEDGKPLMMYGTHQDINERKKKEEELSISEEAFRGNFENAAIGMALLDPNGKWLKINKKLSDIVGYSEEELLKLTFQDITHPEDLDKDLSLLQELVQEKRSHYHLEKRYYHKLGHIVHIFLAVSMVKNNEGEVLYFISQIIDISALKKIENEIKSLLTITNEQNARLRNFAHIVSHNLRSHSSGISGILELLKLEYPDIANNELVMLATRGAINLVQTVNDLTEVVQINLNEAKASSINLFDVIQKNIESLNMQITQAGIDVNNKVNKQIYIKGVPAYVDSIVLNLITNAIKYRSEERKSYLNIDVKITESKVTVLFEDNGLGIDLKRNGDKVFGMYKTFHQHQDSRGVGLFITKNQIESMGGKIKVSSEENVGTTFSVTLPV